jgi:hypothetical protein
MWCSSEKNPQFLKWSTIWTLLFKKNKPTVIKFDGSKELKRGVEYFEAIVWRCSQPDEKLTIHVAGFTLNLL